MMQETISKWRKKLINKVTLSLGVFLLVVGVGLGIAIPLANSNDTFHKNKFHIVLQKKSGFQDQGFEQQAIEGVCWAFKIQPKDCQGGHRLFKENKIGYGSPRSMGNISEVKKYVDKFIASEKTNFFVVSGFVFRAFLQTWLFDNREYFQKQGVNFIGIGTTLAPKDGKNWPKNFWQVYSEEYLPGYYAGLYAGAYALMNPDQFKDADKDNTNGKQIHFAALGGLWLPAIARYALGFKLGISEVNGNKDRFTTVATNTEVLFTNYETNGSFVDYNGAKAKAQDLFKQGISVIFSIGSTLTQTLQAAAKEEDTSAGKEQHWIVGVDVDQGLTINNEDVDSEQLKGNILVSALTNRKYKLADLVKKIDQGEEKTGRLVTVTDNNHLSLPQRFKKTETWKRIQSVILDQKPQPTVAIMNKMKEWVAKAMDEAFKTKLQTFLNDKRNNNFTKDL